MWTWIWIAFVVSLTGTWMTWSLGLAECFQTCPSSSSGPMGHQLCFWWVSVRNLFFHLGKMIPASSDYLYSNCRQSGCPDFANDFHLLKKTCTGNPKFKDTLDKCFMERIKQERALPGREVWPISTLKLGIFIYLRVQKWFLFYIYI